MTHTQCVFRRGDYAFTSWIPSQFAVKGKVLDFEKEGKGWEVVSVWATKPSSEVLDSPHNGMPQTSEGERGNEQHATSG